MRIIEEELQSFEEVGTSRDGVYDINSDAYELYLKKKKELVGEEEFAE